MADPLSSFSGVSSGMDYKPLVAQIITLERRPAVKLETAVAANGKRREQLAQFQTTLDALQAAATTLRDGTALSTFTVATSGADASGRSVLAATAGAGAAPGSYDVSVTQLARSQKTVAGVGFGAEALGLDGTLVLKDGVRVSVAAGDTLATVRDTINLQTATSGIQATLVTGDAGKQHLVLTGTRPGAANAFTPANDAANGSDLVAALGLATPRTQVSAQDAKLTVDGIEVTRAGNAVSDVIPGVTLSLSAIGDGTVTVERRASAAGDAIRAFVDAYNKVQTFIKAQGAPKATLANDSMLRTVRGGLANVVLGAAPITQNGQPTGVAADLATMGALGLSLTKDGTLSFDATRLDTALGSRFGELSAALTQRMGAMADYAESLTRPLTGAIDQREQALEDQTLRMTDRIADIDARLDKKRTTLLAQYARFEASLGKLQAIQSQMSAQFTGLTASNND